jgi:hypothetical protein
MGRNIDRNAIHGDPIKRGVVAIGGYVFAQNTAGRQW